MLNASGYLLRLSQEANSSYFHFCKSQGVEFYLQTKLILYSSHIHNFYGVRIADQ